MFDWLLNTPLILNNQNYLTRYKNTPNNRQQTPITNKTELRNWELADV